MNRHQFFLYIDSLPSLLVPSILVYHKYHNDVMLNWCQVHHEEYDQKHVHEPTTQKHVPNTYTYTTYIHISQQYSTKQNKTQQNKTKRNKNKPPSHTNMCCYHGRHNVDSHPCSNVLTWDKPKSATLTAKFLLTRMLCDYIGSSMDMSINNTLIGKKCKKCEWTQINKHI